jgi:predicted nucleic-acid-binding protein
MIGVDTNVLLRIFVLDDPRQRAAALGLIETYGRDGIFISTLVLIEFVRVFRRKLNRTITETLTVVDRMIEAPEFVIENRPVIEEALSVYRAGRAEFSDCLIVAASRAAGAVPIYTFDQAAAKAIPDAMLLAS